MSGGGNSVGAIIVQSHSRRKQVRAYYRHCRANLRHRTAKNSEKALCHINRCIRNRRRLPIASVGQGVLACVEPIITERTLGACTPGDTCPDYRGVGRGLGVTLGVTLGVGLAVGVGLGVGPVCAQYLPPVLSRLTSAAPPHTIIWLPFRTAVCPCSLQAGRSPSPNQR